jgi:biopolymer transport protein ExbD
VPQGTEVQKLANKSAVANLYIGNLEGQWRVQLNGDLIRPEEIPARIEKIRAGMSPENAEHLTISLRADRKAPMGLVSDVKRSLQKVYALRINYSATDKNN